MQKAQRVDYQQPSSSTKKGLHVSFGSVTILREEILEANPTSSAALGCKCKWNTSVSTVDAWEDATPREEKQIWKPKQLVRQLSFAPNKRRTRQRKQGSSSLSHSSQTRLLLKRSTEREGIEDQSIHKNLCIENQIQSNVRKIQRARIRRLNTLPVVQYADGDATTEKECTSRNRGMLEIPPAILRFGNQEFNPIKMTPPSA